MTEKMNVTPGLSAVITQEYEEVPEHVRTHVQPRVVDESRVGQTVLFCTVYYSNVLYCSNIVSYVNYICFNFGPITA